MTKHSVIFDIDGTLANIEHRLCFIQKSPKDWNSFFAAAKHDLPIPHMMVLVTILRKDVNIVFASGRPERTRVVTTKWLASYGMIKDDEPLYMRKDNDRRDDSVVKSELLTEMINDGHRPLMAFDDRDRVVKMWRACGIPCMQVAEGAF